MSFRPRHLTPAWISFIEHKVGAVGVVPTQKDDFLGCVDQGVFEPAQRFLGRPFGALQLHETACNNVGLEPSQSTEFSATATQKKFTLVGILTTSSPDGRNAQLVCASRINFADLRRRRDRLFTRR